MRQWIAFAFIAMFVIGCGKDSAPSSGAAPQPPAAGIKWTQQQVTQVTTQCVQGNEQNYPAYTGKWQKYCDCIVPAAARRFTWDQFSANYQSCFDQLKQDNTESTCLTGAGIQ